MPNRVSELHNIMPLENIPSFLERGIFSHAHAVQLDHFDISMQIIQDRRDRVQIPGGMRLHQYANLYFHARNPMLYKRREIAENLCILRVRTSVFNISGTMITDQNASSNYVRFLPPSEIHQLAFDQIYAESWLHPNDQIAYFRHKSQKCAEVLVPHSIPREYIFGAYVVNNNAQKTLAESGFSLPIEINPYLFFRKSS